MEGAGGVAEVAGEVKVKEMSPTDIPTKPTGHRNHHPERPTPEPELNELRPTLELLPKLLLDPKDPPIRDEDDKAENDDLRLRAAARFRASSALRREATSASAASIALWALVAAKLASLRQCW